ncbi:MAG: hypothetical protein P8X79_11065 [Reinekea sp.]
MACALRRYGVTDSGTGFIQDTTLVSACPERRLRFRPNEKSPFSMTFKHIHVTLATDVAFRYGKV